MMKIKGTDPLDVPIPLHASSWIRYDPTYLDRALWWRCLNAAEHPDDILTCAGLDAAQKAYLAAGGAVKVHIPRGQARRAKAKAAAQ